MGQLEYIQGEITQNRFLMGISIAIILSLFGYIVSNFEDGNTYLLGGASVGLIIFIVMMIYLHITIKKQIKSLKDIEK
jgi:hypothetical protein